MAPTDRPQSEDHRLPRHTAMPFEDQHGNEWPANMEAMADGEWVRWDEARELLDAAAPLLRAHAKSCEACEGSGERIVGHAPDDYWSEDCPHCKPIWDLVKRFEPPRPAQPVQARPVVSAPAAQEEEDDILF